MAQRTISTRIAIDGEAQYKQSISNINAELRKYQSALGLVQSEYKTNANSLEALTAKQKALTDLQSTQTAKIKELNAAYKNAQAAVDAYKNRKEELTQKIAANEAALEKLKNTEGDTTEQQNKLTVETEKLKGELAENEARLSAAEKGANNWQTSLNKAQVELNKTNGELKQNDKYLDEARKSTDKTAKSIDEFGNKTDKSVNSLDALSSALVSAGVVRGLKEMADAFMACVDASVAYESALTGVEKTTNLTDKELGAMSDSFKQLSSDIPITAAELAGIAENAGQLGIAKEYIVDFTATMADLGVATNLSGEQAAQTFAKFANITGMAQEDFKRLGSAVVALGNNSATTEADIADMAIRLAAAGTQAGMSQADIVAIAAALSSVGLEAEAGGSAFSKAINMMTVAVETGNEQLTDFATIAGMSANEFAAAFRDNAAQAVITFTEGLSNMDRHGKSAVVLLEDLGLTELRLRDSLTRAASAGDLFRESVELGNAAWKENTALTREAQLRYGTTESRLKLLDNAFNRVKVTVGDQLNPAMQMFIDAGTDVLDWVDDFIQENEWVVPVITGVSTALGILAVALVLTSTVVKATVIPAIKAMTASLMANPVFLVVTAVAALTTALFALVPALFQADDESKKLAESSKALSDEMNAAAEAYEKNTVAAAAQEQSTKTLIDRLDELSNKSKLTTAEQMLLEGTVAELAEMYPDLNNLLSENTAELSKSIPVIKQRVEMLNAQHKAEMQRDRLIELETEQYKAEQQLAENERKRQRILAGLTDEQKKHIDGLQNASIETLAYHEAAILLDDKLRESVSSLNELAEADGALKDSLEDTTESLKVEKEQFDANAETLSKYGMTIEDYNTATANMTEKQKEQYNQLFILEQELANLATAYETSYNAAFESIDGQIGLFQTMSSKGDQSIKDLIDSLDSQVNYLDTYADNINKAMEKGVDKGLVQKLSDGSEESAKILNTIVQGGDKDIQRLNEKFGKVEEGKRKFSTTVANMETDFKKNMDAIEKELDGMVSDMNRSDEAGQAARDTGGSYASGLRSKWQSVYDASADLAKAANQGWNDYYEQHSPAKRAIRAAAQTADSYAMGLEKQTKNIEAAGGNLAKAANDAYVNTMKNVTLKATPVMYNLSVFPERRAQAEVHAAKGGGDIIVNVYGKGMIVRNENDIDNISKKLADEAKRKIAAKGGKKA